MNSNLRQPELRRQPIRAAAAVAVGAVVRIMTAVLDHEELDRSRRRLRQALGVRRGNQAILAAGHDEEGTADLFRRIPQRERRGLSSGFGLRRRMAARAEGLAGELGKRVPDLGPVERAGERDAGAKALLEGGGARRVVAAEAHAPHGDAARVEVAPALDPVYGRRSGALVIAADRDFVLGLALPRTVDGERGDAAREERL